MECPKFTPKTAPSPSTITTPSNTPIHRLTPLTNPKCSGSNQPFCHSTLSRQTHTHTHTHTHAPTDKPTDGIGDRSTPLALTLAILIESDELTTQQQQQIATELVKEVRPTIRTRWEGEGGQVATATAKLLHRNTISRPPPEIASIGFTCPLLYGKPI